MLESVMAVGRLAAALGAVLWIIAPWLPLGSPPFGSIEHIFLFSPLVAVPLALPLLPPSAARRIQPLAAVLVLASFSLPKGTLAGALTLGWLAMAITLATSIRSHTNANTKAALVFLPIGAVWLLLSRLGVGPRAFSELTVFLAALHFHYSGFTLQILIAAAAPPRLDVVHRILSPLAIAGIPLIAMGNALASPPLKFAGVTAMVVSVLLLAGASALRTRSALLLASSASAAAGMLLAAIYGVGELTGHSFIGIPRMVTSHGFANASFTLFGLLARHSFGVSAARKLS
jgi:hypothetical protein